MSEETQHGGKRENSGRPKGSINKRSLEAIQEVAERYPAWTPLLHLAAVANDESLDTTIRLDAAKAAAPYCHAKIKQVVADPEGLIELESALAHARVVATASALADRNLAERLERAQMRIVVNTGVPRSPDALTIEAEIQDEKPEPAGFSAAGSEDASGSLPSFGNRTLSEVGFPISEPPPPPAPEPEPYRPILPPTWRVPPTDARTDYDPLSDD